MEPADLKCEMRKVNINDDAKQICAGISRKTPGRISALAILKSGMSLSMGKSPHPQKFRINPCLNHIQKVSNYRPLDKRIKFDLGWIEWQCAMYAFETGDFWQHKRPKVPDEEGY